MKVLRNISVAEVTEVCGMKCVHSNSLRLLNNDHWAFKMDILYNIGNTSMTSFTSNETAMTPIFYPEILYPAYCNLWHPILLH